VTEPAPAPVETPTATSYRYEQIYRAGRQGFGWYLGGIVTLVVLFLIVNAVIVSIGAAAIYLATGTDPADLADKFEALVDTERVAPADLLYVNAVLILGIPSAWLCARVFHDVKPRWLASVRPRIRWGWFFASLGIAFIALLISIVLSAALPANGDAAADTTLNDFTTTTRNFLLVVGLTTPFQAAAEEYVFRGYLTQAFGGWFGSRAVAVVGPALLFALAHGLGQSLPIFFDRFAFGLVAGVLAVTTGGLEAGIAYHVLNNYIAFGFALAYSDLETALNPTGGSWWDVLVTVIKSLVFLGLALWIARAMKLRTRTEPGVLEASRGRM
jgi:membrane protease YdiL (CAAX protease family)